MTKSKSNRQFSTAELGDESVQRGPGGETHQVASKEVGTLTTQQGAPVSDDQNSLKIGPRGPTLLEDQHFREKIFHFDHERIPERVVHARGFGAHGFFENYESLSDITRRTYFSDREKGLRLSSGSRPWRETKVPPTLRGMSEVLR